MPNMITENKMRHSNPMAARVELPRRVIPKVKDVMDTASTCKMLYSSLVIVSMSEVRRESTLSQWSE